MKRFIGIKDLRELLESCGDIYDVADILNARANDYAFKATVAIIEKEANASARKLRARVDISKKLKTQKNTFLKL